LKENVIHTKKLTQVEEAGVDAVFYPCGNGPMRYILITRMLFLWFKIYVRI